MKNEKAKKLTLDDLYTDVKAGKLTKLHTSLIRYYVSRKTGAIVRPYKGKFGTGYKILSPNWASSQFSYVTYIVRDKNF